MQFKSIPWWLWLIPIVALFFAIERTPYGYYTFLRIVVCGFAALLAYVAWEEGQNLLSRFCTVVFGLIAILFNPLVPIFLKRTTWFDIDIGVAIIFAVHLLIVRLGWFNPKRTLPPGSFPT